MFSQETIEIPTPPSSPASSPVLGRKKRNSGDMERMMSDFKTVPPTDLKKASDSIGLKRRKTSPPVKEPVTKKCKLSKGPPPVHTEGFSGIVVHNTRSIITPEEVYKMGMDVRIPYCRKSNNFDNEVCYLEENGVSKVFPFVTKPTSNYAHCQLPTVLTHFYSSEFYTDEIHYDLTQVLREIVKRNAKNDLLVLTDYKVESSRNAIIMKILRSQFTMFSGICMDTQCTVNDLVPTPAKFIFPLVKSSLVAAISYYRLCLDKDKSIVYYTF